MSEVVRESLKTTVKGTAFAFFGMVANVLLWFSAKILIVRTTTKEEFGIYSLALAFVGILGAIANAGLQDGITRYISIFLGEGRKEDAKAVSKSALKIGLVTGLTASMGLYIFAGFISRRMFYMPELTTPLRIISLFCLFQVLANVIVGILRGYGLIKPRVYYINIGQPLFFLLFLGASLAFGLPFISVIYAYMIAMAVVYFGIGLYAYSKIGLNPFLFLNGRLGKELFMFSLPLVGSAIMGMILLWTDTFMLGRYGGADEVGIYNVSMTLARLLTFGLSALGFVFMPIAGELYSRGQTFELKRTYQVLTKWVFAATVPIFFILCFFPEMTITYLFGARYIVSSTSLRFLSIGFIFHVFLGANGMLLIVLGLSKIIMKISVFGAVLNIALNYILIKRIGMGTTGAAIASMTSYIVINTALSFVLYKESKIQPFTTKYLKPLAGSLCVALIIYALAKSLPLYIWLMPIYLVLFLGGYGLSILLTKGLDREDLFLLEEISKKTGLQMRPIRNTLSRFVRG